jgi:hypothetical protein
LTNNVRELFILNPPLTKFAVATGGMTTADNERFLRKWYEVSKDKIGFGVATRQDAINSKKKWFPYNKGGSYRKWFGNRDFVVNWLNDGEEIKSTGRAFPRSQDYYFQQSLTYTATSSSYFGIRYSDEGFIFDAKGSSCFSEPKNLKPILGFLASKLTSYLLNVINPTVEFQTGDISVLPLNPDVLSNKEIDGCVGRLIDISRLDWDSYEMSWDFKKSPFTEYVLH